jgi:hypothetical protein
MRDSIYLDVRIMGMPIRSIRTLRRIDCDEFGKEQVWKMDGEARVVDEMTIDELSERYKNLRLTYFPHSKVAPWEKREKQSTVDTFLMDLERYLLRNHWSVEKRGENARLYRYRENSGISLRIKNYMDYFGVHTVYLIEIELIKTRTVLWDKILADGELVFDYLKRMA